ncbi:flavin reductase family protein [Streptomyces sp. NPDC057199]|uniref:flavin reductase family protein n=1 Tax=Streptomyces sp. NPDC057199 TaxID=3346047 RepID=UPI00363DA8CF
MQNQHQDRIDSDLFRTTMSHFATGVAAVCAMEDGQPVGMAVQSFVSLSLEPPLILISPSRTSTTYPRVRRAGRFAVSVLADHQSEVARALSRKGDDKFVDISWHATESGLPVVDSSLAWMECEIDTEHEAGDHYVTIARVLSLGHADEGNPLTFYRSAFNAIGSSAEPR